MPPLTLHHRHWPPGVPYTVEVPDDHLFCQLEATARRTPDKAAVYFYGRSTSFGEVHAQALALAGYLQRHTGVRPGDRVLLMMQSCPQFYIAYYAVLRCNAVVVAMNPMSTPEEIAFYAGDAGARVLITTQDLAARAAPVLDDGVLDAAVVGAAGEYAGAPESVPWLDIPDFVREPRRCEGHAGMHDFSAAVALRLVPEPLLADGDGLAVVGYTSGTTGKPKGAMLTHRNFLYTMVHRALWQNDRAEENELLGLPLSHLAGMRVMNQAVRLGRTVAVLARWDAGNAVELIERLGIVSWPAVPTMFAEVFAREDIDQRDLSSLQRIYGGASAMPESLAAEMHRRLGITFLESYGLTEFCGLSHSNPPQAARRECAGVPVINCDARIIDSESGRECGINETGEIVMRGPTMFQGYWRNPEATAEAFIEIDGQRFLRSGDIGHYDKDGYFYITDRLKRMINASGLKVWPAEIESVLHGHELVQEACVISARDAHRGETVKALIVLRRKGRGTLSAEELTTWARERLSSYKVPRIIEFVDVLPKTATGKILWRELQAQQDARDRAELD